MPQQEAQEQAVIVQAVKVWCESHEGWLLILDNADELEIVQPFLPTVCPGHLLLTTRTQILGKLAQQVEVAPLDEQEGGLLLLRRARVVAPQVAWEEVSPVTREQARTLTKEVGGLPLALDQAGAYLEETQASDYMRQYQMQRGELLARRGRGKDEHPEPVATTWALSFAKVEQANPQAAELLTLCAFLAPDVIPEELLLGA